MMETNFDKQGPIHATLKTTMRTQYPASDRDAINLGLSLFRLNKWDDEGEATVILTLEAGGMDASVHIPDRALDDLCSMFQKAKRARNRDRKAHAGERSEDRREGLENRLAATGGAA